ncbi:heterokaryon incompatibility protein-domain-containing protein [Aspergillus caelatus]|uniref:Heterokaryon incompatibility protein-domain-containing protein n=1 Tax=Aspergillus caelatus TaxID=61420 RepID=A0A5N6ZIX2_9EURO|nr:heterokaryon incompatibility protein-domain-containing protein [Aspergillus caelatus]KAE8357594.1 heterokaryon incompatibility protein-domain-containing protein [Aspergillus caelatus]
MPDPPVFDRETTLAAIPLLAVAAYNSVELFYWIFSFFRRYHGCYFWSLLVTAWGIIVFVTAVFTGVTTRHALEPFSRKYGHFVIACLCARELLLSGVYLWVAFRNLKPVLDAKGQEGRRVKRELMIINIFVLISAACLLALDNTNHETIKQGYGSMATSVKLKMEFAVLNKLVKLVQSPLPLNHRIPLILACDVHSRDSATDDLCFLCRRIDFEYVGFHDSPEYSSNHYFFQREFPTLLSSSKSCVFCRKLISIITDWFAANPGAHSDRIRVSCSIPRLGADNEIGQPQHLTFFLQRYEGPSEDASQNSDSDVAVSPKLQPYTGRQRPLVADLALFKRWKETCQEIHGAKCSQIFKGTPNIRPRVIDVERRCLTLAEENDQWVCLSYVWGRAKTLRLLKENIQAFSQPGSLSPDVLPNITEDALQVTKGLGERYLWVDSLCIVQDDDQDKAKFISRMDSIYTLATVVIISSTCTDANTPLPGVKPGSRYQQQEPFKIRDVTLVQSLDPSLGVKVDLRTSRAAGYLGETIWDTRAWTLQERFLASRSLVFTGEQVFWECEEAFWCEDSFREIPNISPDPHRTSLCAGELNLSWNSDIVTFDHFYRVLLEDYSGRALSFDSDGLNAFLGIIGALERSIGETFFWGMPTAFLESALAWGHRSHALRRRHGVQALSQAQSQFPSWSWVGWTSDGQTKLANQNLTMEALGLRFYRVSEDGSTMIEMRQNAKFNNEVDLLVEGSRISDRSSRPHNVSMADLPTNPSISLSSLLCFWSASARLTVTSRHSAVDTSEDPDASTWEATLSQGSDSIIQVSWSHIAQSLKPGDTVELVAVAQNRGSWDAGHIDNGAIGVMLISWDSNGGMATREGFAWIAIRDWTSLRDREWKLIVLG